MSRLAIDGKPEVAGSLTGPVRRARVRGMSADIIEAQELRHRRLIKEGFVIHYGKNGTTIFRGADA